MADPFTLTAAGVGIAEATGISAGTLAGAGTAAGVLGGITAAVGKVFGGEASSNMYKYQSGVAMLNRNINLQNADYARHVGEVEAQRLGMKARQDIGQAKVVQSGRGLDVNTGSALDTRTSMHEIAVHDEDTLRANAAKRAYGFEVEASKNLSQANMYGKAAQRSEQAGLIEAGGSLLSTASSVSDKWLKASQLGVGSGRGITFEGGAGPYTPWSEQSWAPDDNYPLRGA